MAKNPPAFPIPNATDLDGYVYAPEAQGMTLRDYFAGQALITLSGISEAAWKAKGDGHDLGEVIAGSAYGIADAMLAKRERGQ